MAAGQIQNIKEECFVPWYNAHTQTPTSAARTTSRVAETRRTSKEAKQKQSAPDSHATQLSNPYTDQIVSYSQTSSLSLEELLLSLLELLSRKVHSSGVWSTEIAGTRIIADIRRADQTRH
ncbi:hypothetical protein E2P81_ATG09812 [Venturia nashicola]|uniref:Uncharacterized protein n=1 Tax=Venturia nashicola TaxID=86259 RepID=A0A4Z1NCI9_9PEZI|nr:hypothetical protein E6O75_ATG10029 [Venturia nashicola]TLD15332.1 hypothetical protein E2P81_ATG09812 [Venturia nashicola]